PAAGAPSCLDCRSRCTRRPRNRRCCPSRRGRSCARSCRNHSHLREPSLVVLLVRFVWVRLPPYSVSHSAIPRGCGIDQEAFITHDSVSYITAATSLLGNNVTPRLRASHRLPLTR